jgi:hypothetical protein
MKVEGPARAEQFTLLRMDFEDLRQRAQLHPVVDRVTATSSSTMNSAPTARVASARCTTVSCAKRRARKTGISPGPESTPPRRASGAKGVRQLHGALGEPGNEHGGVLVGVAGKIPEMIIRGGLAALVRTIVSAQRWPPPRCRISWPTFHPGHVGTAAVRSASLTDDVNRWAGVTISAQQRSELRRVMTPR